MMLKVKVRPVLCKTDVQVEMCMIKLSGDK